MQFQNLFLNEELSPLSAAQHGTHLDCMKITAKFAACCETCSQSKSHILIKPKGLTQRTSFVLVNTRASGVQYEREAFNLLNQYHPLHKHKRQTNAFRQKMKHLIHQSTPFTKVYPFLYTICTETYKQLSFFHMDSFIR